MATHGTVTRYWREYTPETGAFDVHTETLRWKQWKLPTGRAPILFGYMTQHDAEPELLRFDEAALVELLRAHPQHGSDDDDVVLLGTSTKRSPVIPTRELLQSYTAMHGHGGLWVVPVMVGHMTAGEAYLDTPAWERIAECYETILAYGMIPHPVALRIPEALSVDVRVPGAHVAYVVLPDDLVYRLYTTPTRLHDECTSRS